MDAATAARLLDLNKQFYQTFGREFASTRGSLQPGVRRVLGRLKGNESILDLGCGNGGVGHALARRGHVGRYIGLDFSQTLLEEVRCPLEVPSIHFIQADLTAPDWEAPFSASSFDVVLAFAVLHHIPGMDLRLEILRKSHALLQPGGRFVHSEWQFLNSAKLRGRLQPWTAAGILPGSVEAEDYLLDWRQGGRGLRYVHAFGEAELEALAAASRFEVRETFHMDGEGGRLGLYQVWQKVSPPA